MVLHNLALLRLWTSGTLLWLVWWHTSVKPWSTLRSFWTCWWSVRIRSKPVSRLGWTPKCLVVSLLWCFTPLRSWVDWECFPWDTYWFHSLTLGKLFAVFITVSFISNFMEINMHPRMQAIDLKFFCVCSGGPNRPMWALLISVLVWVMRRISLFLICTATSSHGRVSSLTPREFGPNTPSNDRRPLLRTGTVLLTKPNS